MSDWEAMRSSLDSDGWSVLRKVLENGSVLKVSADVFSVLERHMLVSTWEGGRPVGKDSVPQDSAQLGLDLLRLSSVHRLAHDPRLIRLAEGLLKGPVFAHPQKVIRVQGSQVAGGPVAPGVHQDAIEVQGGAFLTFWIPLCRVDPLSGALPVYTQGDNDRLLPLRLADTSGGWEIDDGYLGTRHVNTLSVGDVLVFRSTTPHGGAVNMSSTLRLSMDVRYQLVSEPLCRKAFELMGGKVGWDDVYDGSEFGELEYYWRKLRLQFVEFDPKYEDWRKMEALRADVSDPRARRAISIVRAESEGLRSGVDHSMEPAIDDGGVDVRSAVSAGK